MGHYQVCFKEKTLFIRINEITPSYLRLLLYRRPLVTAGLNVLLRFTTALVTVKGGKRRVTRRRELLNKTSEQKPSRSNITGCFIMEYSVRVCGVRVSEHV